MTDPVDDDAIPTAASRGSEDAAEARDAASSSAAVSTIDASGIKPLDVDGVAAIGLGTVLWLVALLVSLVLRDRLAASGDQWWIGVCLAGFLLGLPGLVFLRWRRARHATPRS